MTTINQYTLPATYTIVEDIAYYTGKVCAYVKTFFDSPENVAIWTFTRIHDNNSIITPFSAGALSIIKNAAQDAYASASSALRETIFKTIAAQQAIFPGYQDLAKARLETLFRDVDANAEEIKQIATEINNLKVDDVKKIIESARFDEDFKIACIRKIDHFESPPVNLTQLSPNLLEALFPKVFNIPRNDLVALIEWQLEAEGRPQLPFAAAIANQLAVDETPFDKDLLERIVADSDKLTPESRSALIVYAAGTRETLSLNVMHALCKTSEPRGQLDKLTVTYEMLKEDKFKEIATHYKPQIARVLYAQQSIDGADLAALTSHLSLVDPNKVKDLTFEQWAALPQNHREKFIHQITDIASLSLEKLPRYMSDTEVNALEKHLGDSITEEHCVALLSICFSARLLKRLPRKCINDLLTKDFVMKHLKYKGEELVKAGYTYNWLAEVPLNDDSIQYLPEILTHLEFGDAHKHFWALALQDKVKVNTSSGEYTYLYMLKKIANRKGCNLTKDEVKLALPQDGEPSIVPLDHLANAFIKLSDDCTPDLIEGVSAQHTNPLLPLLANGVPNRAVWAEALDAQHSPFAACFKGENTRAQKSVNYNLSLFTTQQKNTLAYEPPHPSNFDFRSLSDLQMFVDVIGGITSPNKLDEAQKINQTNVITHFLSTLTKERAADHRHAILILQLISHLVAKHPTVPVFSIVNSQYTDFLTDHRCEALEPHVANLKQVINDNPTRKPFNYDRSSLGKLLETTFKEVAPKLY